MNNSNLTFELAKCLILDNGNKVQNLRKLKKLTIKELAKSANVSEESLKSIECQKIELIDADLTKIANALNVDVDLLLDSTMSMDNQDMYWLRNILQNHKTEINFSQLQAQIMNLINIILYKNREQWSEIRKDSIESLCKCERKNCARKARKLRDEKYAPFREYFKKIQYEKFMQYHQVGKTLSANYFAMWYLTYKSEDMPIPYVKQNIANKLVQLAQYNNREFKKLLREEADTSIVMED